MIDSFAKRHGTERGETGVMRRPVTELLQETASELQHVVRGEVRVAISKARDELTTVVRASVMRAAAGVVAAVGMVFLMIAAVAFLEMYVPRWGATLIVGALNILIALALVNMPTLRGKAR